MDDESTIRKMFDKETGPARGGETVSNDTQVRQETPELPEWTECQSMFVDGSQTPLTEFIRAYEPVDPEREQWRTDFASALATVRREVWREAILILDTAPGCHSAGKWYIDPVALVQRMNAAAAVEALVNEVQHRMDQVVEAAVEWHQAGHEGTEWFEAAERLGAAIDSLLEMRDDPVKMKQRT